MMPLKKFSSESLNHVWQLEVRVRVILHPLL